VPDNRGSALVEMFPPPSFITANLVARQLGYRMPGGWGQGDEATNAWFAPLSTYEERLAPLLDEITELGFTAIDLWGAHLSWRWATPEHIEIARRLLADRALVARSYVAWVKGGAAALRAACRVCSSLGIPLIAGDCDLLATDRAQAVGILRQHGVACALENHAERTARELFARLGNGDGDVIGVALDTGWCGTREWDVLAALDEVGSRLMAVHLKDIKPRRPQATGLEMIDMGHETCRVGEGILPLEALTRALRQRGFRGSLGIEHEPEEFDPRDDIRASRETVERWWSRTPIKATFAPFRVVVVGCGNIASAYGKAMGTRAELAVLGATDLDSARATAWTSEFGGEVYPTLDAVLEDPQVEAVVNLTTHSVHADVIARTIRAGKHVHTEKPMATTYAEAASLVQLAEQQGVRISCAPATWLGEAQQTAWKLIRDGSIGMPRVAYAAVDWSRIERWHPNPEPFYEVGPVFDVGVYPLTLLTAWFGPVARVIAGGGIVLPERMTIDGRRFTLQTDDLVVAVLEFRSGLLARLTADFYVGDPAENRAGLEVHGDRGSIATAWFAATASVRLGEFGGSYRRVAPIRLPAGIGPSWCDWSAGIAGLADGLRNGRPHPTSAAHAAHVVEVMEGIHRSASEGAAVRLVSQFPPPDPQPWAV
jgi:predicted dehydrogenase/sugar phosphate isomerase/epimerase